MILATSHFRTKIVILAGLEAFLGPLGAILEPLGAVLGRSWGLLGRAWGSQEAARGGAQVQGEVKERSGSAQADRSGTPPLPKLLAKANSKTIMSLLAN